MSLSKGTEDSRRGHVWEVKGPPCLVVLTGKSDSWAEQCRLRETGSWEPLQGTGKNALVKKEG